MTSFRYTDRSGAEHDVPLIISIDELDIDAAEALEDAVGVDIRSINTVSLTRQLRAFVFISLKRFDPAATPADVGKIKLGGLLKSFKETVAAQGLVREITSSVVAASAESSDSPQVIADRILAQYGDRIGELPAAAGGLTARNVMQADDPLVSEPPAGGRDVHFTAAVVVPVEGTGGDEVLSPGNADSEA